MNTLKRFLNGIKNMPAGAAWYLADIAEAKGKQDLFVNQSPQKLKVLKEHALIESAISSNRIEGVEIDKKRVGTVIFGRPLLKDRNEEEIQGYRDTLELIHKKNQITRFSESTIKKIHKMIRGKIWDAGKYKEKDSDIIERLPTGDVRTRFKTVTAKATPLTMNKLISYFHQLGKDKNIHPLILIAASNLDFLCIHPFRDGNGRVSRLLLLMQLYNAGYEVGRYISLERLIEEHKERYYETLETSSKQWHENKHNPWAYISFLLYILKKAYNEFESRFEKIDIPKGGKTEIVIASIKKFKTEFTLSQLQEKCPNVSRDMIRKVLKDLHKEGRVESKGRGLGARWKKKGNTLK